MLSKQTKKNFEAADEYFAAAHLFNLRICLVITQRIPALHKPWTWQSLGLKQWFSTFFAHGPPLKK